MLLMCDRMVPNAAFCFGFPNHMSSRIFAPSSTNAMSTDTCLKLRVSEPRGPVTVTTRDLHDTVTARRTSSL